MLVALNDIDRARQRWSHDAMRGRYGNLVIAVGNSTSIVNHGGQSPSIMTLQEYIQSMRLRSKSDSRQYAFDGDFFERSADHLTSWQTACHFRKYCHCSRHVW